MEDKINISRYKELRKVNSNSLTDETFFELIGYNAKIESHISYNQKEKYFSLIKNYLSGVIAPNEFRSEFFQMERQNCEQAEILSQDFEALEHIILTDNLEIFCDLKVKISMLCSEYGTILDDGSGGRMTESEFYAWINACYFQLQKIFPVLSSTNLPYERLIQRSFNMLISIIGLEGVLVLAYLLIEN